MLIKGHRQTLTLLTPKKKKTKPQYISKLNPLYVETATYLINGERRRLHDGGGGRDGGVTEEEQRTRERSRGDEDGYVGVVAADGYGRRGRGETLLAASGAGGRVSRSGS